MTTVKVHLHSEQALRTAKYRVRCQPAADLDFVDVVSCPKSWFTPDGEKPRIFVVEFEWGAAEVPDDLGRYMVDRGIAHRTKMPSTGRVRHFFDRAGKVIGELFDEHGNRVADYDPRGAR
jgi:hypothetical protein